MVILDTNVVSELMRSAPDEHVWRWCAAFDASDVFTTTITQAEIRLGIAILPKGRRRDGLSTAADKMFATIFADRILGFDGPAAEVFAQISSARRQAGFLAPPLDAQIAAIARSRGAKLATRNVKDFEHCGVDVVDPWEAA